MTGSPSRKARLCSTSMGAWVQLRLHPKFVKRYQTNELGPGGRRFKSSFPQINVPEMQAMRNSTKAEIVVRNVVTMK